MVTAVSPRKKRTPAEAEWNRQFESLGLNPQ
jgi:hypothetical protein